jgi:hypothetical protein
VNRFPGGNTGPGKVFSGTVEQRLFILGCERPIIANVWLGQEEKRADEKYR